MNVNAAAQLVTTRTINGVNFNGTANILVPSTYDANYRRIDNPGGAEYVTTTATITGAIQITLPVGWTNSMIRMTVRVYEYATNKSFDVVCGGYNYSVGYWVHIFAYILGDKDVDRRFGVRFGYNASGKCVIYIGELASTWSYPQVFVTDVQIGYSGQSATWVSGWAIGFQASAFENVTDSVQSTQVGYGTSTSTADALVLRDASFNFAANNITANTTGIHTGNVSATSITATDLVTLGTNSTYRKRVITTLDQGANNTTYELARISRDSANWTVQFLEITAFNRYYRSGKTKWNITYNQVDAGTITCEHASGTIMHKVYLGAEVLVSGTIYYRPVLIDLPQYTQAAIEVNYGYGDVTSITNGSQIYFTNTYVTNASASASYSGDIHLNPSGGNTGIGNTSPAHKLRVTGTTSLAGAVSDITTLAAGNTTITGFVNATSSLAVGTAFTANATVVNAVSYYSGTLLVANTTVINATHLGGTAASGYQTTAGLSANVATLTSNNATNAFGKTEGNLNVNNATTAYGKTEGNLNVNAAARFTTARTLTIGSTGKSFDGTAGLTWTTTEIGAEYQAPFGIPRTNLGDPTAREMALFDGQFNNKTELYNINNVYCETSTNGTTWSSYSLSDTEKRKLLTGDTTSSLVIPYNTAYFRIRIVNVSYVFLNALYLYTSTNGHSSKINIFKKQPGSATWVAHTTSTNNVDNWPGHVYLPFDTIGFSSNPAQYDEVAVVFQPTWNATYSANPISIYRLQIWGGYPAGKRNIFATSEYGDATFPANVVAGTFSGNLVSRNINGTAFNGSADITTTNWGTTRNINGTSVNGSANYAIGRIYDTNYRRFTNPGGGEYVTATPTITGAIQIVFPNVFAFGMYKMTIEVYEYVTNQSFTVVVAGHTSTATWYNTSAYIIGNPSIDRRFTVRFGRNAANKAVVYIGELASSWSYPQVFLTEFQCGYSSFEDNSTGWAISFNTTAFENVTQSITNSQVGYAVSTNTINSAVLRDGSGNFSAGTITASLSGNTGGTHIGAVVLGSSSLSANGGVGTAGQVLHSNGSATYWAADDNAGGTVTSVASGNGITGGTITSTGTLSAVAGTGTVVNATGIHVNATYIATLNANNAYYINGNTVVSVMESLRANRNITGGGTITVDASYNVLWSSRFIIISNGRGAHFSTQGYFDITCATSGTITGVGGAASRTATAAGIQLGAWESLYYILPLGGVSTPLWANFRISGYTADVEIPSDWVLICTRNADGAFAVSFPNGINLLPTQSYNTTIFSSSVVPAANTSTLLNGKTEGNLNVNNATTAYGKTEGNLNVNSAASATTASQIDGVDFRNGNGSLNGIAGPDNLTNNGITYVNGISLLGQSDGALYAQAYSTDWVHQIYGDYRSGQIAVRGKNSGTWQAWRTILDSTNYTSYSPSLTGSGASGTWGINVSTGNSTVNAVFNQFGASVQEAATINATYSTTVYMSDSSIGYTDIQPTSVVMSGLGAAPNIASFGPSVLSIGNSSIVAYMQPGTLSITNGSYNANLAATTLTMSFGGNITTVNATVVNTTTVNATSLSVGTAFTANATVVNAVSYYAGTLLVANTTVINATHLGGVAAANYARTDVASAFSGIITFNANAVMTKSLSANGGFGTAGQVLTSGAAANAYWATPLIKGGPIGNIDYNTERTRASGIYSVDGTPTNGPPSTPAAYSNFIQMYERGDTAAQIIVDYSTGYMYSRGIQTATPTYSAWRTQLNDTNIASYAVRGTVKLTVGLAGHGSPATGDLWVDTN